MEQGQLCLRRGEERELRAGKLWIYDNEIDWVDELCRDGEVVEVLDSRMHFLARGFFNSQSKITVRILSRDRNESIDDDFFRRRLEAAWSYRKNLGFSNACRVVFGESDGLPGLTVDKFGDYLSLQILSLGMDRRKQMLVEALESLTEKERSVITFYYYEELTLKEIAAILEVSESRISQLHTRALEKMRMRLGDYVGILTKKA